MALTRGLFIRKDGASVPSPIGTGPVDARKDLASLVAVQDNVGTIRSGLFYPAGAATVVTGNATGWQYNVAAFQAAIARIANNADGVTLITNDGPVTVPTIGAPGTGSRYDLLYLLINESTSAATDSKPSLNCYSGPNSGTPSKSAAIAALPAGAYLLASALVPSTAVSTADAAVTITQEFRWTAARGSAIPVRTLAERQEFTAPFSGLRVKRLDLGNAAEESYDGTIWHLTGVRKHAEVTGPILNMTANIETNAGLLVVDAANTFNNTFLTPDTAAGIKFLEAGTYLIYFDALPSATHSNGSLKIIKRGTTVVIGVAQSTGYGYWEYAAVGTYVAAVGDFLDFKLFINTAQNVGTRMRITKLSD